MDYKHQLRLSVQPCYFVPDITERFEQGKRVHIVGYYKCNFRCEFCVFAADNYSEAYKRLPEYTLESFEQKIWDLLSYSKNFKFTGGEPTLNPSLIELMRILRIYGAKIFLDTNGSMPHRVKPILEEKLADIVGVSLKGLSAEDALKNSNIKNSELCWDNVLKTIDMCAKDKHVQLIVTYVACDGDFSACDMEKLAELLKPYPDIVLKINNCYLSDKIDYRRKGLDKSEIYSVVESFVNKHPEYKGRTVLFSDYDACLEEDKAFYF